MIINYKSRSAQQQFDPAYQKNWRYPIQVTKKLLSIETFLRRAPSLMDVHKYQPYRFHKLNGKRSGEWSICVGNTGYRVTLIPCDDAGNEIISGDIVARFSSITIVSVTEVSNHYE